jgi:hypothetical protein
VVVLLCQYDLHINSALTEILLQIALSACRQVFLYLWAKLN